jgi:hypothetical protein
VGRDELSPSVPLGPTARASGVVRSAIVVAAVAYIAYVALLVTCDLRRVAPLGFAVRFANGAVTIPAIDQDSIAARAGLLVGDRITQANGQELQGQADWQRVRGHLDPSKPLELQIEREGRSFSVPLLLSSGLREWTSGPPRPALLAFRFSQVITLAFALVVAFRRAFQPSALLGALLLASLATVSVVLPMRLVAFWHALPAPIGLLLWWPFATSVAVGPLLFAFFAVFPRRLWSNTKLGVALVPAALASAWHVYAWHRLMEDLGPPTGLPDWIIALFIVNVLYGGFAIALLLVHWRDADTLTEQRRIRVLTVGSVLGVAAGSGVVMGYWRDPGADIFATRTLTVLSLVFLAVPASFAYTILRHRLFDVRLIVRQGLRYALARQFVDALIPALGALVIVDILLHRTQPLLAMLQSRWWWFTLVGGALLVTRSRREAWLKGVDRRFFRERYDAQRLLTGIADQISRASSFDAIAPSVLQQIDEALHPEFVTVLRYLPAESIFSVIPSGSATERASPPLPASLAVIGVLSVLRKPLALSLGDTAWVRHQLPLAERTLLVEHGIELLVPISSDRSGDPPLALLVLGPRRSEEPYNQEDLDLLVTIAQAVGMLLERSSEGRHTFAECESCGRCFDTGIAVCTQDQQPLSTTRGSRTLNGRYRLERRLGRGGMATVYAATDDVLERQVAVKLIRDDMHGPLDLDTRFRREARAAAGLAHPHVVRVYDFGVDQDLRSYLVMELLEGATLRQRLASGSPLSRLEALHVLRGVCSGLGAAHRHGLVHRDLKPENIFLQRHPSGVVPKILDFGLAKAFAVHASMDVTTVAGTSAGLLVGTLDYMAPEQAAGDEVSPAWDLWALAVIAYEMVTGNHPFRRSVTFAAQDQVPEDEVTHVGNRRLSDAADAFFRTALSTERAQRPAGAREFLSACEQVLL